MMRDHAATRIQAIARGKRSRKATAPLKARKDEERFDHKRDRYGDGNVDDDSTLGFEGGGPVTVEGGRGGPRDASTISASSAAERDGRRRSVEVKIDRKAVELIASLVDERIMVRRPNALCCRGCHCSYM